MHNMIRFCDVCGTKFQEGDLRPKSKFCPMCGEQLSPWVIEGITVQASPATSTTNAPSTASISQPQQDTIVVARVPRPNSPGTILSSLQSVRAPVTPSQRTDSAAQRQSLSITPESSTRYPPPPDLDEIEETTSIEEPEDSASSECTLLIPPTQTPDYPELSLDIKTYNLPPPFPVPSRYNQAFSRRRVICKLLGGNTQRTYPVSKNRKYPMYACPRMDHNPTVPRTNGHHGILITKPIPREFPSENFVLFVKDLKEPVWYYRGQYRIVMGSYLSPSQWAQQTHRFKRERISWILNNKDWGHNELNQLGLAVTSDNARQATERGDIKWEVKVLECIGFDIELYRRLVELADET